MSVAGWIGAMLILAAYGLLTAGRLTARSPAYQWMNVGGAGALIVYSAWKQAWPSAVLNLVWAGIGLVALWNIARRARSATPS